MILLIFMMRSLETSETTVLHIIGMHKQVSIRYIELVSSSIKPPFITVIILSQRIPAHNMQYVPSSLFCIERVWPRPKFHKLHLCDYVIPLDKNVFAELIWTFLFWLYT